MMLVLLNILKSYRISIVSKVFKCVCLLNEWMPDILVFQFSYPLTGVIHETKFGT